jgi:hypothetical protein
MDFKVDLRHGFQVWRSRSEIKFSTGRDQAAGAGTVV